MELEQKKKIRGNRSWGKLVPVPGLAAQFLVRFQMEDIMRREIY